MDHAAVAKRYRDQAEEFRGKAGLMTDETARASYMGLADVYDGLAAGEDKLAFNDLNRAQAAS